MADPQRPRAPLVELTWIRIVEFSREPGALFWVFGFPILLSIALGLAFRNRPPDAARVVVVEVQQAAWVEQALAGDATLAVQIATRDDAIVLLRRGQVDLLVEAEGAGAVRYRFDDTRPESRIARLTVQQALEAARGMPRAVPSTDEKVTEKGSRYIDFLLPALIAMNLLGSSMWALGYSVVDARRRKLLKRLAATPMRRSDYLLSLLLSRLALMIFEVACLVIIGELVFGVHVQGSYLAVGALALLGGLSFTSLALLIAARPQSTEVASGWINFAMLPMWLLSGSFFSASRFPDWLQPAIQALPLTALNDGLRAVINEGASLSSQLPEVLVLLAWAILPFPLALKIFRWQ